MLMLPSPPTAPFSTPIVLSLSLQITLLATSGQQQDKHTRLHTHPQLHSLGSKEVAGTKNTEVDMSFVERAQL